MQPAQKSEFCEEWRTARRMSAAVQITGAALSALLALPPHSAALLLARTDTAVGRRRQLHDSESSLHSTPANNSSSSDNSNNNSGSTVCAVLQVPNVLAAARRLAPSLAPHWRIAGWARAKARPLWRVSLRECDLQRQLLRALASEAALHAVAPPHAALFAMVNSLNRLRAETHKAVCCAFQVGVSHSANALDIDYAFLSITPSGEPVRIHSLPGLLLLLTFPFFFFMLNQNICCTVVSVKTLSSTSAIDMARALHSFIPLLDTAAPSAREPFSVERESSDASPHVAQAVEDALNTCESMVKSISSAIE